MEVLNNPKSNITKAVLAVLVLLAIFFAVKTVAEIKNYKFIGGGAPAGNVISFSGSGEVFAAPDIAQVSLTIREEAKEMGDAQNKVAVKEKAVLEFLDKSGIAKKDIKTESYNSYPKYDYGRPCYSMNLEFCPPQSPTITGYEVSEYISVKVRDLGKAGEIVQGIGQLGISEINGPSFSIENEDELKAQARKLAIDEAKAKAETLANDLGVRLVRIVNFSEDGNYPMMYGKEMMALEATQDVSVTPQLPTGENKIVSNVVITYEIR